MSVGNAVLDQILKKGFLKNVQIIGKYFYDQLNQLQSEFPNVIKEVRGLGLLLGIKVTPDQNLFVEKLLANKLLTIRAAENVVRLLPPLNVKKENIDQAIVILRKVCKSFK
jgi:acetylornithine/N-succinyldiaminopimelate aminotransferase